MIMGFLKPGNAVGLFVFVLAVSFVTLAFSAISANAYGVWTSDQTGNVKTSFYTNETVYVTGGNVTNTSENVRVYVVANNDSWVNGKTLVDITGVGYVTVATNSSGYIPVTSVWASPTVGSYDVVADVDKNGTYNSTTDFVNSSSATGFSVAAAPVVRLTVEKGPNSPSNHNWNLGTDTGHNSMLQLRFSASVENVKLKSVSIAASGTGNDKNDITVAYLVVDSDGDGQYDQGESLLGYENYFLNDGVVNFDLSEGYSVPTTGSVTMLITYYMSASGQSGSTYKFDVVSVTAEGWSSGETATITGLPITSSTKTLTGGAQTTTTTTTLNTTTTTTTTQATTTTTTTTIPTDECEADDDCPGMTCNNLQKRTYSCIYDSNRDVNVCASTIISVGCCSDSDCEENYYCLNYECVTQTGPGGLIGSGLSSEHYTMIMVSIGVVGALVVILFFVMKNRVRKPWRSKKEYEERWDSLRRKWKR